MNTGNLVGTIGVSILLIAFLLITIKVIKPNGLLYFSLNLIGAALAGYSSWLINFIPFVVLEWFWVLVSLAGIIKIFMEYKNVPRGKGSENV